MNWSLNHLIYLGWTTQVFYSWNLILACELAIFLKHNFNFELIIN